VATHVVPLQAVVATFVVGQAAQTPPHRLYPLLHVSAHDVPSHVAVPLGEVGQTAHEGPQAVTLVLG
jgi:hypothetical protein